MLKGAKKSVEYVSNNHSKLKIYFIFSFKIVVVVTSYSNEHVKKFKLKIHLIQF